MSVSGSQDATDRQHNLEAYLLDVAQGRQGLVPALLRTGLGALAPVYCAGLKTYLLPYNLGIRKRARLNCPVVCVGNLTTGGTGKTPMTQMLCRLLMAQNKRVAILSRGYGGANEYGCALVSDGANVLLTAAEAGDEAYLLAQTLPGVPVVVGKDRRITGALAEERFAPDVIVMDDGMQFWQLHRDLDIVLLNAIAPFDNGWTFPRGLLREPPSHLRRAGAVVLTNAQSAGLEKVKAAREKVARLAPNCPVFTADLVPAALRGVLSEEVLPLAWLQGRRVIAVSALGNPASFEQMLRALGAELTDSLRFRDHKALTNVDWQNVAQAAAQTQAEAVLTTEKDAVKISAETLSGSEPRLLFLQIAMRIERESEFLKIVSGRINAGK